MEMIPQVFPECNATLKGFENHDPQVADLPVYKGNGQIISKWKLSPWGRIQVLFMGYVWLRVLTGDTQPPVSIEPPCDMFTKT